MCWRPSEPHFTQSRWGAATSTFRHGQGWLCHVGSECADPGASARSWVLTHSRGRAGVPQDERDMAQGKTNGPRSSIELTRPSLSEKSVGEITKIDGA